MHHAHIDISRGLDGDPVVFACFDLREDEIAAAARAVAATAAERYRTPRISADDVLELRELTALADELDHGMPATERAIEEADPAIPERGAADDGLPGIEPGQAIRTMVFQPARLSVLRDSVATFVESRDEGDWIGPEDREPLAILRSMLAALEQLCADAMRAALSPESHAC
ncbi:MAG: hypothetical protein ACRDM7_18010 [Thermoleophilaceae bacterium]